MTSAQVVETSVNVDNNSSFQNYTNPDDHTQQTYCVIIKILCELMPALKNSRKYRTRRETWFEINN